MLAKEKTMNMLQPSARIFFKKNQYHLKSSNAKDINQKKKKTMSSYIRKGASKYASITAKQEKSI